MDLDIQTEHVAMTPEWHRVIDAWVVLCRRRHPGVGAVDLVLRHGNERPAGERVEAVATAGPRRLRAHAAAEVMSVALGDALDRLEHELCAAEAVQERSRVRATPLPTARRS